MDAIQKEIFDANLDGWLLYDFRGSNALALDFLKIPKEAHLTRRFFYWIPNKGDPVKIVHAIESNHLDHLEGIKKTYSSHIELETLLKGLLQGKQRVAMEYSPLGRNPYLSTVDGGTIDWIRSFGIEVMPSSSLVQKTSLLTPQEIESQRNSASIALKIAEEAFDYVGKCLKNKIPLTEYLLQQYIEESILKAGQISGFPPIVAVNAHSANPHYSPKAEHSSPIQKGDLLLIDLGCKSEKGIFADITKMALIDRKPDALEEGVFNLVREAQKRATDLIQTRWENNIPLHGYEVDKLARDYIYLEGYGPYFLHRLGHSLTDSLHGSGAHLDSFETIDERLLLPNTCLTIEPGLYLPSPANFGIRLEYDILLLPQNRLEITGGIQDSFYQIPLS